MKTYTNFKMLTRQILTYPKRKIVFSLLILYHFCLNSYAQDAVRIAFNPSSTSVGVGQSFTVDVRVQFISGSLDFAQIHFNFDKTKLAVTSITKPSTSILPNEFFALQPISTINNNGQVNYAAGTSSNFPSTDFSILSVTFTTLATGTTSLTFRRPPTSSPLTNAIRSGSPILSGVTNGTVNILSSLPVGLLNLSATPQGKKVTLSWATSSETNNRGFDVQRSNDGVNWTTIGFVAGAGNSSFVRNYTYTDDNLETRRYYYRLKQIDIDEHSKYSVVVSAVIGGKGEYALGQNYPNPFRNETTIQYTLPQAGQVHLSLFDISGRAVKVLVNGSKEAGTHSITFNTGSLTRGIYYYRIQVGDFTDVKKLTIQ